MKSPYEDEPADAAEVAKQIGSLVQLTAATVATMAVNAGPGGMRDGSFLEAMATLEDATKDPGQSLFIQETRLALALLSWSGQEAEEILTIALEAVESMFEGGQ